MIKLIQGHNRRDHHSLIDQMHVIRRQVFHERLKWDVEVLGGWEVDGFDACNPLYVLSIDNNDHVQGCLRLLPTTGMNMLADIFPVLLEEDKEINSPLIWESSRFCVNLRDGQSHRSTNSINAVTAELIAAMGEVTIQAGIKQVVTVYDAYLRRIIRRAGCEEKLVGGPVKIGKVNTFAGLFDVERAALDKFKKQWSLPDELFVEPLTKEHVLAA